MKNSELYPRLLSADLFEHLPSADVKWYLDTSVRRHFSAPTEILRQGTHAEGVFLVAQGRVEVSVMDSSGNVTVFHNAPAGETLGELEVISDRVCIATCRTQPDATVLLCPRDTFREWMLKPTVLRNVGRIIVDRFARDSNNRLREIFMPVELRLRQYLGEAADAANGPIELNQQALARRLGCTRETINRRLSALRRAGLIAFDADGRIRVLDRAALDTSDQPVSC